MAKSTILRALKHVACNYDLLVGGIDVREANDALSVVGCGDAHSLDIERPAENPEVSPLDDVPPAVSEQTLGLTRKVLVAASEPHCVLHAVRLVARLSRCDLHQKPVARHRASWTPVGGVLATPPDLIHVLLVGLEQDHHGCVGSEA